MSNQNEMSEFDRTFGAGTTNTATNNSKPNTSDKPKAQVWLNIGYEIDTHDKDGNAIVEFISLPVGIPLDTMEKLPANQRDRFYQKKQQAANSLLDQVNEKAKTIKPGEEIVVGARGSLQIQIRRIKAEAEIVDQNENELISSLTF